MVFDNASRQVKHQLKRQMGTICLGIGIAWVTLPVGHASAFEGKVKFEIEQYQTTGLENRDLNRLKQKDDAETYYERGNAKYASGDFKEALDAYNKSIRLNPNYAPAYNNRGNAKDALEDYQGAIADYTESIRIDPDYPFAYYNRGITKKTLGDLDGAIADYTEAIRIKPEYPQAYGNRGLVKVELGDKKGALADLTEAAKIFKRQGRMEDYRKAMRLIEFHKL